jgi:hypothetical protein
VLRALALLCVLLLLGCGEEPALPGPALRSVLAVGDAGADPDVPRRLRRQRAVAEAMARHDREHPADALLLLGDNFYPDGLTRPQLARRIRANLVAPWCRFVALQGPRSPEVADACELSPQARRAVPIFAVLGNHDHHGDESPRLQEAVVPEFVSNWRLSREPAVVELGDGLSLVLFDSTPVQAGAPAAGLAEALVRADGPWRILALHHPLPFVDEGTPRPRQARFRRAVADAVAASGAAVQMVLSGHEHNLQLLDLDPGLQVIAGGGSSARPVGGDEAGRLAAAQSLGYARVDLVRADGGERLVASLYAVRRPPLRWLLGDRTLAARASVDLRGTVLKKFRNSP